MQGVLDEIRIPSLRERFMHAVHTSPIEIAIGAVFLGAIFGIQNYQTNLERDKSIPLAFSEIEKTEARFAAEGRPIPPLTRFYSSVNDVAMKVFEARNRAYDDGSHDAFARALKPLVERSYSDHKSLSAYAREMPETVQSALEALRPEQAAAKDLPPLIRAADEAWGAWHNDHYRTEYYSVNVCSGSGETRRCRSESRSRRVYKNTTHHYTYSEKDGVAANQLIQAFVGQHIAVEPMREELVLPAAVGGQNREAITATLTRNAEDLKKGLTEKDVLHFARRWATGSTYAVELPKIVSGEACLAKLAPAWERAMTTAGSISYTTYSRVDSGPKEFQDAEETQHCGQKMMRATESIVGGIGLAGKGVPLLEQKIRDYIGVVLDGKTGNADLLRDDIMEISRKIYTANIERGLDVYPFKPWQIVVFTLIGGVIGGLAGFGADRYIDKYHRPQNTRKFS